MQLYFSKTSPFARKVRVALLEKGLEVEDKVIDPWNDFSVLGKLNPLMRVPALVTDSGVVLPDSEAILHYLERRHPQPSLWPDKEAERTAAEGMAALAHGVLECAVFLVLEGRRPDSEQSKTMIERRKLAIRQSVDTLEEQFHARTDRFHLDGIGIASALAYIDFRKLPIDWRNSAPRLVEWLAWANARPSMQKTAPPEA